VEGAVLMLARILLVMWLGAVFVRWLGTGARARAVRRWGGA
jgi:hypothetical protein